MKKSEPKTLKKTKVKTKPTKKRKSRAKKLTDVYPEFYTARKPYPPMLFERLADDYISWAKTEDDALVLTAFPLKRNISVDYFKQLCLNNEILIEAHATAKAMIAERRERLILQGKLRERPGMYMMHRYSDDWDKADKRWAELKKPEESKSETQIIVLDSLEPKETDEKE